MRLRAALIAIWLIAAFAMARGQQGPITSSSAGGPPLPVSIANGGTGQITQTAAFDALSPLTTQGDVLYHNGTNNVRLAKGTGLQLLRMNSGATAEEWTGAIFQEWWQFVVGAPSASWNPADSTSYYLPLNVGSLVGNPGTTAPTVNTSVWGKTLVPMALKAIYLEFYCGVAASSETSTFDIRINNSTNTQILTGVTCTVGAFAPNAFNATGLSVALAANDWFALKFTTPAWVTNPTGAFITATIHATGP